MGFLAGVAVGDAVGQVGRFFRNHVEILLLRADEILHTLAGQFRQCFAVKGLAGFGGVHPEVGLFGGQGQEMHLHFHESIDAAANEIGDGRGWCAIAGSVLHGAYQNLVLSLRQVKQDAIHGDQVGYALANHLGEGGHRRGAHSCQPFLDGRHSSGVLPHHQIQQDPLSGEETLRALPGPLRYQGEGGRRLVPGCRRFGLRFGCHY